MIQVIPAIDIIDGKCVRLTEGDYATKKVYDADPLDLAMQYEDNGLKRLHLVDLDGAKNKQVTNWKVLEKIATKTSLFIDFGGGMYSDKDTQIAFECGARQVIIGSTAVKNESMFRAWLKQYGPEKIILGADVKNEKIAVSGWEEDSGIYLYDFIEKYLEDGIQYVLCTDISKDGKLQGTSTDLYEKLLDDFSELKFIASGGVASMDDIEALNDLNIYGVVVGKALLEGRITLDALSKFLIHAD